MPVKRRTAKMRENRITAEAIEAYKAADTHAETYSVCLNYRGCKSDSPGRHCADCRTYLDQSARLDRLLGLKPWEPSPLEAKGECPWPRGTAGQMSWPKVCELREELERLAAG